MSTVQVSLDLPHNTWFTVLSWWRDKEMFLQHRTKKSSSNVRHCHFHVLCQSQHQCNSRRHDRRCSSKERSWVRVTRLITSRNRARSQFSTVFPPLAGSPQTCLHGGFVCVCVEGAQRLRKGHFRMSYIETCGYGTQQRQSL